MIIAEPEGMTPLHTSAMHEYADFFARGRDALLEGKAVHESPPVEGGPRWGASAVLRPTGLVLGRLTDLATSLGETTGPGHWVHGPETLHTVSPMRPRWTKPLRGFLRSGSSCAEWALSSPGYVTGGT